MATYSTENLPPHEYSASETKRYRDWVCSLFDLYFMPIGGDGNCFFESVTTLLALVHNSTRNQPRRSDIFLVTVFLLGSLGPQFFYGLEGYSVQSEARHNVDGRGLRTVPFCYSLGWGLAGSSRKRASDGAVLLQFQFVGENVRFLRKLVPVLRVR